MNEWLPEEEIYLHSILKACETLSNAYLAKHIKYKTLETRIKIPMIVIGSFTGITSFGSETFPEAAQKYISISVGVISIGIAIMNTIESYFRITDTANSALNASTAFQQLREDINKELSIPTIDRQAAGITFVRDIFTRYQQILSQAPILDDNESMKYVEEVTTQRLKVMKKRNQKDLYHQEVEIDREYIDAMNSNRPLSPSLLTKIRSMRFSFARNPVFTRESEIQREIQREIQPIDEESPRTSS